MSALDYETVARFAQQFGILYFAVMFVVGVGYALRPRDGETFRHLSRLPLDHDESDHV
ncbi:MAG: cbb3-type cytochrome c oxidase subunit 3 [Brevundimonas sp.]|jgi:cytochrome c oxidase cbb3-type subunit 4